MKIWLTNAMRAFLVLFFVLLSFISKSQDKKIPATLSIFNNGTSLPGSGFLGVFSKKIHPGITAGTYLLYGKGEKHEFFQTFKLGYFYHRFAQHGIQLYSEGGYRFITAGGLYAEGMAGLGYVHSFPDIEIFIFKDGKYVKKKNWGRPQLMISTGLGLGYDFEKKSNLPVRIFLNYQFWLQTPFVNKYVPLLPNTAFHIGASYKFARKSPTDSTHE